MLKSIPSENGNGEPLEFAGWQESSLLAEAFRQTVTSILRAKPKGRNPVYVLTSVGPGEGKTTLSVNLAIAMAGIGKRVLLVDADLRRARLHTLFGLEGTKGLSDLLTSAGPLGNVTKYMSPTRVTGLHVMTHGMTRVETPAILFFSSKVKELL